MADMKIFPIRLNKEIMRDLRKLAYLHEISMAEIVRAAIIGEINKNKKVLTNSDIAI